MSKYLKYGIIEDIETTRRIRIGQFWGISLFITPITWLSPFIFFGLHFILNLLNSRLNFNDRLIQSFCFTLSVEIATAFHAFGHILSGKIIGSAMDELLITATRDINLYHGDQSQILGHIHLVRSLGGPIFNLLIALICFMLVKWVGAGFGTSLISSLISTNLFFGIGGFIPLPSVDGEVIWREILKLVFLPKT
jgi:hypothetical protein